ncbi:unnamed protein product [Prunus armeniaca]
MAKDDESIVASNIAYVVVQSDNIAREKMGYIRGKEKAPPETNPKYDKWYVEKPESQELVVDLHDTRNYEALHLPKAGK